MLRYDKTSVSLAPFAAHETATSRMTTMICLLLLFPKTTAFQNSIVEFQSIEAPVGFQGQKANPVL